MKHIRKTYFTIFFQNTYNLGKIKPSALQNLSGSVRTLDVERVKGIEPSYPAWEAGVLPLNYTRMFKKRLTP